MDRKTSLTLVASLFVASLWATDRERSAIWYNIALFVADI